MFEKFTAAREFPGCRFFMLHTIKTDRRNPYFHNLLRSDILERVEKGSRACLKKAFCKMCVTIFGRFCPDEGAVAGYGNRIRAKYTAKWGVQIAGMIFQTRSNTSNIK